MVIPASSRIVLLAPSQPSTTCPVNVCGSPGDAGVHPDRGRGERARASSSSSPIPRRRGGSRSAGAASTRASSSSSRSGWWNMFACGKPCWPACWSRLNSAITRCLASSRRSPLPGRDRARNSSLTPIRSRILATSSSRCTARGSGWGWVWRSSRVTRMPESASRRAAVQPTGPAPTTMTGSWVAGCRSFMVVVPLLRVTFEAVWGAGDGPGADGEGESGEGVADLAGVGAGHGDDQPSVFVRRSGAGVVEARRGQRLGHRAGGGVCGQRGLELLAHRGDRDRVDRVDVLGPGGGLADRGGGPREQLGLVEPAGSGGDDVGHRDLAGVPVGAAHGRGVADGGVAQQRFLDHPRVDVVAAADDEVLGPAGEVHEAVGVDTAEVAGVQPAVADDALPAHPGAAEGRIGDVAGEHGGPADREHAGLAGSAVRPAPVVADPDGFDLLSGQGAADRPGPFLAGPGPGARAGRLGKPVALQQAPPGVRGRSPRAPMTAAGPRPRSAARSELMSASTGTCAKAP